jgi:hypothetical protein
MTTTIRFALPVALLLAVASSARAQTPPADGESNYRWQVAATDAAVIGAGLAGFALEGRDGGLGYVPSNTLMGIGIGGYFLGAPIVHLAHKEYARAGISLLVRFGLPIVGAAIGARFATCTPDQFLCGFEEMGKGMEVGAVAAAVVDTVLITSDRMPAAEPERIPTASRAPAGPLISPRLVATPNAAIVGVGGRF